MSSLSRPARLTLGYEPRTARLHGNGDVPRKELDVPRKELDVYRGVASGVKDRRVTLTPVRAVDKVLDLQ